jgi:hypothetical protein
MRHAGDEEAGDATTEMSVAGHGIELLVTASVVVIRGLLVIGCGSPDERSESPFDRVRREAGQHQTSHAAHQ